MAPTWVPSRHSGSDEAARGCWCHDALLTLVRTRPTGGPRAPEPHSPASVPVAHSWQWSIFAVLSEFAQLAELQLLGDVAEALLSIGLPLPRGSSYLLSWQQIGQIPGAFHPGRR